MLTNTHEDVIKKIEQEYPETCKELKSYMDEMYLTFCKKQNDYGPGNISLGTTLQKPEDIKASLAAITFRMNDKIQRLINLIVKKNTYESQNEAVRDTFIDLSVYAAIADIVSKGKWSK